MNDFTLTPDNVDQWCGPEGVTELPFDGHVRQLNAKPSVAAYGEIPGCTALEDICDLIPRDEWVDRIKEIDAADAWLERRARKIPCKDQNGLGYCHAYGTTSCIEIVKSIIGDDYVELSAESIGGRVTDWTNTGANPDDDLRVAIQYGACAASYMDKPWSLNHRLWKQGWEQNALQNRVLEHIDCRVPNKYFDAVATCAFKRFPAGLGFVWWSHFIHGALRLKYDEKARVFYMLNRNSWGKNWGDNGFTWMQEGTRRGQGTPGWAFGVRYVTAA